MFSTYIINIQQTLLGEKTTTQYQYVYFCIHQICQTTVRTLFYQNRTSFHRPTSAGVPKAVSNCQTQALAGGLRAETTTATARLGEDPRRETAASGYASLAGKICFYQRKALSCFKTGSLFFLGFAFKKTHHIQKVLHIVRSKIKNPRSSQNESKKNTYIEKKT